MIRVIPIDAPGLGDRTYLAHDGRSALVVDPQRDFDRVLAAWEAAGAPVNRGRTTWELERQVRLVAGGIAAASVLGSVASPKLKWVAAAVGTGLVGAALTNTCAMGMALSTMPWNRGGSPCDVDTLVEALAEGAAS